YIARVTRVNAAAAASLALAPLQPVVRLGGAESRYDARLRWTREASDSDLAGYAIVMRATTAPYWEREIFVGNVTDYTFSDTSSDEYVFGVKAVDKDGNESLVGASSPAARMKRVVEIY